MHTTRWLVLVGGLWFLGMPALAQETVDKLEEQLRTAQPAAPPRPEPGYLGAVTDDRQPQAGVQVMQVTPNSPAAAAGLLPGDLIVAVNGQPIQRMADFARYMTASAAGTKLSFRVDRNGRETAVAVTLGARPNDAGLFGESAAPAAAGNSPQELLLGVATIPLSTADRRRLGVPVARGAVVTSLTPQSAAAAAGLPVDAVIVGVNNLIVEDPAKLDARLQALGPGRIAEIAYYQGNRLVRRELQLAAPAAAQPPAIEDDLTQRLQELERRVEELEQRVRELEK